MSLLNKQVFAPASKNELFVNCLHNGKFATFSIQSNSFFGFDEFFVSQGTTKKISIQQRRESPCEQFNEFMTF